MFDSGIAKFYKLVNRAEKGMKPEYAMQLVSSEYFDYRTVGYSRRYRAMGANVQIDLLIRIWMNGLIKPEQICVIEDEQYRIESVSLVTDDNGLKCNEITLTRVQDWYEVIENADET